MGHERVGLLPKTKRWRDIVALIASSDMSEGDILRIAQQTLNNLRAKLNAFPYDEGVQAAFKYLTALSVYSRLTDPNVQLARMGIDLPSDPTPLSFTKAGHEFVNDNRVSLEYAEIAKKAAGDAIAVWYDKHRARQASLIEMSDSSFDVWHKASDGSGFCDLSRIFFAKFTERYLNYFLEREASAVVSSLEEREKFHEGMRSELERVSQHAFETSKITQSFAAGWFNKNTKNGMPADKSIQGFLSIAFGKISEELRREGKESWKNSLPS